LWTSLDTIGIGAIPALPTNTHYLELWMKSLLTRGGWQTSDHAIGHATSEQAIAWRQAADEPVLIVADLPTTKTSNTVAVQIAPDPELLATLVRVRRLLRASETALGVWEVASEFGVTLAESTESRVVYRQTNSRVRVPVRWTSSQFPLGMPVLTTALAAFRATEVAEFLLRTEVDWRLREQLTAIGLEVELQLGPANGFYPELIWRLGPERSRARHAEGVLLLVQRDGTEIKVRGIEDVLTQLVSTSDTSSKRAPT